MWTYIIIGVILQACFIMVEREEKYLPAVVLKGLASLGFVLLGIHCSDKSSFANMIVAGLIFGMAGDILLNLRYVLTKIGKKVFLVGILIFMIGHIIYLAALLQKAPKVWMPVGIGILLAAVLLKWIFSKVTAEKAFKIFGIFYVGAVSMMAVVSIWNWLMIGGTGTMIFALGGVLFLISDVVLIFNTFTETTKFSMRVTNLSLYYIGQILIACSLLALS